MSEASLQSTVQQPNLWARIAAALETVRERTIGALFDAIASAKANRDEVAFSVALIALSAKMARADGAVTDNEIAAFQQFFQYPESEASKVRMIYQLAQQDVAGFDHYIDRVAGIFHDEPVVLEDVLDCLFHVALADGVAHPDELALLENAARRFGMSASAYGRIRCAHLGLGDECAYSILGLEPGAPSDQVRARYRELMREHHPDALIGRGVPANLVRIAENRTAAINAAYEKIRAGARI